MIAIIPCAGKGTRRHPETTHTPKILLEYAEKPLIEHIVRPIDESGKFEKIVLVLSLKHGQQIIDYINQNPFETPVCFVPFKTPVSFVWQNEPLGFGHAVLQARDEVFSFRKWNPPVLVCTDDGIREKAGERGSEGARRLIKDITGNPTSTLGVQWRGNVRNYGMAIVEDYVALGHAPRPHIAKSGVRVERLVEKPYWDEGGLALTGIYYIRESRRLFRCLNKVVRSGRVVNGEYQLTTALQLMIDADLQFETLYHSWTDCGKAK